MSIAIVRNPQPRRAGCQVSPWLNFLGGSEGLGLNLRAVANPRAGHSCLVETSLLSQFQRRSAHALYFEIDIHLDAVGDLDERDAASHTVVLTIEGHLPLNLATACPARSRQSQRFRF